MLKNIIILFILFFFSFCHALIIKTDKSIYSSIDKIIVTIGDTPQGIYTCSLFSKESDNRKICISTWKDSIPGSIILKPVGWNKSKSIELEFSIYKKGATIPEATAHTIVKILGQSITDVENMEGILEIYGRETDQNNPICKRIASLAEMMYGANSQSTGKCLWAVQNVLDAAKVKTTRVASAYLAPKSFDASPTFISYYRKVFLDENNPTINLDTCLGGTIIVFDKQEGHPNGHIEIKASWGTSWISDYRQAKRVTYAGKGPKYMYVPIPGSTFSHEEVTQGTKDKPIPLKVQLNLDKPKLDLTLEYKTDQEKDWNSVAPVNSPEPTEFEFVIMPPPPAPPDRASGIPYSYIYYCFKVSSEDNTHFFSVVYSIRMW